FRRRLRVRNAARDVRPLGRGGSGQRAARRRCAGRRDDGSRSRRRGRLPRRARIAAGARGPYHEHATRPLARHGAARQGTRRTRAVVEPHVRDDPGHVPVALKSDGGRGARAFRIALLVLPLGVLGNLAYLLLGTDRALLASIDELPRAYLLAALGLGLVPWIKIGRASCRERGGITEVEDATEKVRR